MEVIARANHLRIAPRKTRLVAGLIRGLPVRDADVQLRHLPKRAAEPIRKLLDSAIANAKHNFNLDKKNLRVKQVIVNSGPVLKRTMPRAFGRAALIRKRSSHIILTLDELQPSAKKMQKPKIEGPELRRASIEELKEIEREEAKIKTKYDSTETAQHIKGKAGFRERIFNRKAV
ncbi:MAG: 50S ribosomal protein L22 [Candidatus Sungbacteria bacterium]|uniref:Large ribosomal subunit protein uL22 n=1 Tax=Candidatus Sungiibacteriota bacterium TaxID=2750080 RepID=A0A9D6QU83_9BACT|nr:50S ribosomal protein L22 [Candidatus Sungbacteria bacterium]